MQRNEIDICVIEDDAAERALLVTRLAPLQCSIVEADSGDTGLRAIYQYRPRVVICDVLLPVLDGIHVCRRIRSDPSLDGTYVVIVSAYDTADRKKELLRAGADDYLRKPYDVEELLARIRAGLRLNRLQERLQHAALTDGLTELWNHNQFRAQLDREYARARRYGGQVSLMMLDLDHFKAVNDTHGHEVGNQALKLTARLISRSVRETDFVARYGGEEFAVICPETSLSDATVVAERIRTGIRRLPPPAGASNLRLQISIGIATTEDSRVSSVTDLINLGDQALYESKRAGRNRVTRCDELLEGAQPDQIVVADVERLRKEIVALAMRSKQLCLQSVWALIQALEARDGYSAWHSRSVTAYTRWLAKAAGGSNHMIETLSNAAMLHDLGKIGLRDELLFQTQPADQGQAAALRQVPLITCKILEPLKIFRTEILIIRHLRERYDGTGWPDGLRGGQIPYGSRLLAITEAFDSLTCDRALRPGHSLDAALDAISAGTNAQFDPQLVDLLRQTVGAQRARWQQQIRKARVGPAQHKSA